MSSNVSQLINDKGSLKKTNGKNDIVTKKESAGTTYTYRDGSEKVVDPVVARLKEKRRLEKEKKEEEERAKKGLAPKKSRAVSSSKKSGSQIVKHKRNGQENDRQVTQQPPPRQPAKKMNFNQLIKKANQIDHNKLSISLKSKSRSPEAGLKDKQKKPSISPAVEDSKPPNKPRFTGYGSPEKEIKPVKRVRAPLPTRGPSAALKAKLGAGKANKNVTQGFGRKPQGSSKYDSGIYNDYDSEEEDDDEGFIVPDEDQDIDRGAPDYDRDEIWAMFNRGKKRSYYDKYDEYDSDDMEATGAEVLEEEWKSKLTGEMEDRRELEEEQKLAASKKARKEAFNRNRKEV